MNPQAYQAERHIGGRYASPMAAMEIVSDSTICLAPHGLTRHCPACGTVFRGSVITPLTAGCAAACPYCLHPRTKPLLFPREEGRGGPGIPLPALAPGAAVSRRTNPYPREERA